jgi:hypothetical protein
MEVIAHATTKVSNRVLLTSAASVLERCVGGARVLLSPARDHLPLPLSVVAGRFQSVADLPTSHSDMTSFANTGAARSAAENRHPCHLRSAHRLLYGPGKGTC